MSDALKNALANGHRPRHPRPARPARAGRRLRRCRRLPGLPGDVARPGAARRARRRDRAQQHPVEPRADHRPDQRGTRHRHRRGAGGAVGQRRQLPRRDRGVVLRPDPDTDTRAPSFGPRLDRRQRAVRPVDPVGAGDGADHGGDGVLRRAVHRPHRPDRHQRVRHEAGRYQPARHGPGDRCRRGGRLDRHAVGALRPPLVPGGVGVADGAIARALRRRSAPRRRRPGSDGDGGLLHGLDLQLHERDPTGGAGGGAGTGHGRQQLPDRRGLPARAVAPGRHRRPHLAAHRDRRVRGRARCVRRDPVGATRGRRRRSPCSTSRRHGRSPAVDAARHEGDELRLASSSCRRGRPAREPVRSRPCGAGRADRSSTPWRRAG